MPSRGDTSWWQTFPLWEDLDKMVADVHQHVRDTGRPVESADDPFCLLLGYCDPVLKKAWQVRLVKLKGPHPLAREMATAEGRLQLANRPLSETPV